MNTLILRLKILWHIVKYCIQKLGVWEGCQMFYSETDRVRLHIGRGIKLEHHPSGDLHLCCLSEHSVFVQSFYLDQGGWKTSWGSRTQNLSECLVEGV